MRMIGHVADETAARRFGDFLYASGIDSESELERDGRYAVWIKDEDRIADAEARLREFQRNPADPRYEKSGQAARELREREAERNERSRKRQFDGRRLFPDASGGFGRLTFGLVSVCVGLGLLAFLPGWAEKIDRALFISYYIRPTLPEIRGGEIWRLITPILVHGGVLHLLFNMMWLLDLGTMVERRQGTVLLALFVVGIAIPSNLAQYFMSGPAFCGMSGVVYGLIGYIWLRGKFDPASGLHLNSTTVTMMVIWYFLCLFGVIPRVANTVHTVGFLIGLAWGFISALIATGRLRF